MCALMTALLVTSTKVVRAAYRVGVLRLDSTFEMVNFADMLRCGMTSLFITCILFFDCVMCTCSTSARIRILPRVRRRCRGTGCWGGAMEPEKNRLDTEIRQLAKAIKGTWGC